VGNFSERYWGISASAVSVDSLSAAHSSRGTAIPHRDVPMSIREARERCESVQLTPRTRRRLPLSSLASRRDVAADPVGFLASIVSDHERRVLQLNGERTRPPGQ